MTSNGVRRFSIARVSPDGKILEVTQLPPHLNDIFFYFGSLNVDFSGSISRNDNNSGLGVHVLRSFAGPEPRYSV